MAIDDIFQPLVDNGTPDTLIKLTKEFYTACSNRVLDLSKLKESIVRLLEYLTSDEGRTDENCNNVDFFIFLNIKKQGLEQQLPEEYKRLIRNMGGQLHDTISDPEAASMFDSLPEQLLERAKKLLV